METFGLTGDQQLRMVSGGEYKWRWNDVRIIHQCAAVDTFDWICLIQWFVVCFTCWSRLMTCLYFYRHITGHGSWSICFWNFIFMCMKTPVSYYYPSFWLEVFLTINTAHRSRRWVKLCLFLSLIVFSYDLKICMMAIHKVSGLRWHHVSVISPMCVWLRKEPV